MVPVTDFEYFSIQRSHDPSLYFTNTQKLRVFFLGLTSLLLSLLVVLLLLLLLLSMRVFVYTYVGDKKCFMQYAEIIKRIEREYTGDRC